MTDPRLVACFVKFVNDREPRLQGRVRPAEAEPGLVDPCATFAFLNPVRVRNYEGRTGQTAVRVQIDVWSQDHALGASVAHRIAGVGFGDDSARGLDQWSGFWEHPTPDVTPGCEIQFVEMMDDGFDDIEVPTLGTETGWYRFSGDFTIHYEETE